MQGGDQQTEAVTESPAELEQLIVFDVDREEYAVPITDIKEVLEVPEITPVPDSQPFVLGVINLRGNVVPVIDLEKRLGLQREQEDTKKHIVITDYAGDLMGVRVDLVKEVLKVPTKFIQPTPSILTSKISPEFLQGVVVITKRPVEDESDDEPLEAGQHEADTDARIVLLLELKKIISPDEVRRLSDAQPPLSTEQHKQNEGEA